MSNSIYEYNHDSHFLQIQDARLIFKNFKGEKSPKNRDGKKTFCVVIDDEEIADRMREDGFNVRKWRDYDILTVRCNFRENGSGPHVVINSYSNNNGKLKLTACVECDNDTVGRLDDIRYDWVDLSINPYRYEKDDESYGYSAYLSEMYVNVIRSALEEKYAAMEGPEDDEDDTPF